MNIHNLIKVAITVLQLLEMLLQRHGLKFKGNRWEFEAPLTACSKQLSIFFFYKTIPRCPPNTIFLSKSRLHESLVHLQRCHLHVWDFCVLRSSRWAVTRRSSHRTEARGGSSDVGETRRPRHSRTPQEPTRCHQVPVALRVREGVA